MRILVASDTYPPQLNGAAVSAQRFVRGLAGRGHRVEVVAPNMAFRDEARSEPETPRRYRPPHQVLPGPSGPSPVPGHVLGRNKRQAAPDIR